MVLIHLHSLHYLTNTQGIFSRYSLSMKTFKHQSICITLFFLFFTTCIGADTVHTVEKGETFYSISRKYGITLDEIYELNQLSASSVLKVGQKLVVAQDKKASTTTSTKNVSTNDYTVKKGDTLYSISRANGISVAELQQLNGFTDKSVLKVDQVIKVPGSSVASSSSVPSTATSSNTTVIPNTKTELPNMAITEPFDPRLYSNKKGDTSLVWPVKATEVTYVTGKISGVTLIASKKETVTSIKSGTVM